MNKARRMTTAILFVGIMVFATPTFGTTPDLATALDCTNLLFTVTGGDEYWVPQTDVSHDAVDAVRCDAILAPADNAFNYTDYALATTVSGPGELSFWWKVENNGDGGFTFEFRNYCPTNDSSAMLAALMDNDGTPHYEWFTNACGAEFGAGDVTGHCTDDGEWVEVVCDVGEGEHTFMWSVSTMFGRRNGRAYLDGVTWIPNGVNGDDDSIDTKALTNLATYCVIDLSAGPNASSYPVSYLAKQPDGGFNTDEYKKTKLVLRRIEPGTFLMRGQYETTLTKPYYIGIFEVTQKQYDLVMGSNPSQYKDDMRPAENVLYDDIRGRTNGAKWPSSSDVDSNSFMGKIRLRTGIEFDLPTEAQWEYACRAGTTSSYNNGGSTEDDLRQLGRYSGNQSDGKGGYSSGTTTVGSYLPNAWGLYDMHGNVVEWCLDWAGDLSAPMTDPQGPTSGARRRGRGGAWRTRADECTSTSLFSDYSNYDSWREHGIRLVLHSQVSVIAIRFSANGGSGSMTNIIAISTQKATLPPVGFTGPNGAAFLGWATTPDGLVEYEDCADIRNLTSSDEDVITLHAKWNHGAFTVHFDANGGTGGMADQTIPLDLPQPLSEFAYERDGHIFAGWATEPDGSIAFANEETISNLAQADGVATLYAIWREGAPGLAIRYYDTYDYGYPAFGQSESAMIAYFGSHEPALSTNSYDWGAALDAGYMEAGRFPEIEGLWREETETNRYHGVYANKAKDYFAMALGGLIEIGKSGTYRFAASADDQIALYIDGAFICGDNQWDQLSYGETFLSSGLHRIIIGTYERNQDHGMFIAWKRPGDTAYTPIPQSALSHRIGSDMLEFFPGDGNGQMSSMAVDRNFGALLPPCTFTKTGHSPAWALEANGDAVYADRSGIPPGITNLYAVWIINQYTVSFNSNGGTEIPSITQDYGTVVTAPANPTRTGYTFRCWTPSVPTTMPPNDVECAATWGAITYTVRFSANGGTGAMTDFRVAYDTAVSLPPVEFADPNGAAFLGWATSPDGLVEYGDETEISNLSSNAGDVVTLYAKWNRGSFMVHFDANGGSGDMADVTVPLDLPQALPNCAYERGEYYFVGWSTSPEGSAILADGETIWNLAAADGTLTLYAKWWKGAPPYCIINLSAGASASSYPVTYLAAPPAGGFNTDEYKTKKLVLRRIEPGTFLMGGKYETTLTKPYYIGIFETTQKQYELVMGGNPSYFIGERRPVERVSYNMARGTNLGSQWPASDAVDADSFIGKIRMRTGLDFDLPTEAQWEYACRAGTTTTYSYGDSANGNYMWYADNSSSQTHEVGTKQPNPWGLYDMHGNVLELCLDWYESSLSGGNDPKGPSASSVQRRVGRGGGWSGGASRCTSSDRDRDRPHYVFAGNSGIRLALPSPAAIHTICFSANGGSGAMTNIIVVGLQSAVLPPVGFTGPNGATFLGWATTPNGRVEYVDGADIGNLSSPTDDTVVLYARWALPALSEVTAQLRSPESGVVDVGCTLSIPEGTVARLSLTGYDVARGVAMVATSIEGDGVGGTVESGRHLLSWDVNSDYPGFTSGCFRIAVKAEILAATTYHIQIYLDDHDFIKISENKLWIDHIARKLSSSYTSIPGAPSGMYTVYINGVGWEPKWPGLENGQPSTNCTSSSFTFPASISPLLNTPYTLEKLSARNTLRIDQQPTEGAGGILSVEINDPSSGQVWYEFNLMPEEIGESPSIGETIVETSTFQFGVNAGTAGRALDGGLVWNVGGDGTWTAVEDDSAVGGSCARSGEVGDSESSWIETSVNGPGSISFQWKVSSQARLDRLTFSVDGETKSFIAGTTATVTNWAECSFAIDGDGLHTLRWTYEKSPSGMAGEDCGWLDNVQWMPVPATTFSYGEALDTTRLEWTSGGDDADEWEVVESPSFDGEDACAAFANAASGLARIATEVDGPGTISFSWRIESGTSFAGIAFMVDGEDVEYCENDSWAFFEYSVSGVGTHTLAWEYFWDGSPNGDAAFLDCVSWMPAGGTAEESVTVEGVTIPHHWLSNYAAPILNRFGGNYVRTANASAANGVNKVWECYVAGLNPTNAASIFRAVISLENGKPVVGWEPDLNEGGTKHERVYTVEGKANLTDSWAPTNSASRFFRVKVSMP